MKNNIKKAIVNLMKTLVSILISSAIFVGLAIIVEEVYYNTHIFDEIMDFADGWFMFGVLFAVSIGAYELTRKMLNTYTIVNVHKVIIVKDINEETEVA